MKGIFARKIGMTRIFAEDGRELPITVLEVKDNLVTQIKTKPKDGYQAIQMGAFERKKPPSKSLAGHLKNLDIIPRKLFEIKTAKDFELGDKIGLGIFHEGEKVNISSTSKGKGFAGTVKRHGFHLGPKTHGSNNYRQPGSIGSSYPQRVIKGRRMPGRLGGAKTTVKNLEIVKIDNERSLILLKGAVPGPAKSAVLIWSSNES